MSKSIFLAILVALFLSGCSHDQGVQGLNSKQADALNSERSKFEASNDPPLNGDTYFAAGQLSEAQGDLKQAVKQYQEAVKANPRHTGALYRLGLAYCQLKQFPEAIGVWNRYITATNQSAVGYSNLAYCQELSGNTQAAEISYCTGISRDPNNEFCRVNYGIMLAKAGKIDDATAQFSAVLPPAQVHYNLASVFEQQGKFDQAKAEYRRAITADPKFIDAQTRLTGLQGS